MNPLQDSHAQLMVHWLGEGTDVMICLARETPLTPAEESTMKSYTPVSSSIYISYDYGDTFIDKSAMFPVELNGTIVNSTVDQFMTHPKFHTVRKETPFLCEPFGLTIFPLILRPARFQLSVLSRTMKAFVPFVGKVKQLDGLAIFKAFFCCTLPTISVGTWLG